MRSEGEDATDRQARIPGFRQTSFTGLTVLLVGCGGLGSHVAQGITRAALAGTLKLVDDDVVRVTDLNRQLFSFRQRGRPKPYALAENLKGDASGAMDIIAYACSYQEARSSGVDLSCDVAICGVDNNPCRVSVSNDFRGRAPVIFLALSANADMGYVFVQEGGGPCWGCLFPDQVGDQVHYPCAGAVIDSVKVVAGLAVYALTTLFTTRPRAWNYFDVNLPGFVVSTASRIRRRADCPLCGVTARPRPDNDEPGTRPGLPPGRQAHLTAF